MTLMAHLYRNCHPCTIVPYNMNRNIETRGAPIDMKGGVVHADDAISALSAAYQSLSELVSQHRQGVGHYVTAMLAPIGALAIFVFLAVAVSHQVNLSSHRINLVVAFFHQAKLWVWCPPICYLCRCSTCGTCSCVLSGNERVESLGLGFRVGVQG